MPEPLYCEGMLLFRSEDLQTATIHADLTRGLYEPAEVAGEDWLVPLSEWQEVRARIKRFRQLEMRVHVEGQGEDPAERSESWSDATQTLMGVMDFSLSPGTLTVIGPYLGLPEGTIATVSARAFRHVPGPIQRHMSYQRHGFSLKALEDWEFESS